MQNFGDLSPLVAYTGDLDSGGTIVMSTDGSTALTDSDGVSYTSVTGDKENLECSGRGLCTAAGADPGFGLGSGPGLGSGSGSGWD